MRLTRLMIAVPVALILLLAAGCGTTEVGKWVSQENSSQTLEFFESGTFTMSEGAGGRYYRDSAGRLVLTFSSPSHMSGQSYTATISDGELALFDTGGNNEGTFTKPEVGLGAGVLAAMLHEAFTWVSLATFTLTGLTGIAFMLGRTRLLPWEQSLRWISQAMWGLNAVFLMVSMDINWGGVMWNEPILLMTIGLLLAAIAILAVQLIVNDPRVPAVLDAIIAAAFWTSVFVLPNLFRRGFYSVTAADVPAYRAGFPIVVAAVAAVVAFVAVLVVRRRRAGHAVAPD